MNPRAAALADRIEAMLTAPHISGGIMLALAASQIHRPRAQLSAFVTDATGGMLNAYGLAALFVLCGLYLWLRRPRPTALWTFVASLPLAGYALAGALLMFSSGDVSWTIAILSVGVFVYTVAFALQQSRRELDDVE